MSVPDFVEQLKEAERELYQRRARRRHILKWTLRTTIVAVVILLWQFGAGALFDEGFSGTPSGIVRTLVQFARSGSLWPDLQSTLIEVLAGYGIGVGAGIFAACLLPFSRRFYNVVFPFIQAFYGIPKMALAPILVMWFGLGIAPKLIVASIMCFFVVFVNTVMGLNSASEELLNVARVMGASRLQLTYRILFPSALPYTVTAMRVASASAVLGAILGEFVAAQRGVGVLINRGSSQLAPNTVFAGVLILTVLSLLLSGLLVPMERWIGRREPKQ
ncbi:MAG: ABC transporter permease [Thermotogota bacterium]